MCWGREPYTPMDVCVNRGREPYTPRDVCVGVESLTHRGMYVLG